MSEFGGIDMPEISIGAIGAAIIAALVSLMGLVVSKEQKTSEFRQAWIDALRAEIVNYTVHINAIADKLGVNYPDHSKKVEALTPHYSELNKAAFGIKLRLNPKERQSKNVIEAMKRFEELASDDTKFTADNIRPVEENFEKYSKKLLKHEWNRVKKGESFFVVTKYAVIIILFLLIVMAASITLFRDGHKDSAEGQAQRLYKCAIRTEITPSKGTVNNFVEAAESSAIEKTDGCSVVQERNGSAIIIRSELR